MMISGLIYRVSDSIVLHLNPFLHISIYSCLILLTSLFTLQIVAVQACQGSRHGIQLQVPQEAELQVSNVSAVTQIAQATDPAVHMPAPYDDMKINVSRPHTVLLLATATGRLSNNLLTLSIDL